MIALLAIALSAVSLGVIVLGVFFVKAHKAVVFEAFARQRELEELSFIDQKERRAYLGLAEKRIAAIQPAPQGVREEEQPDDIDQMMSAGNRRMRAEEWLQAQTS